MFVLKARNQQAGNMARVVAWSMTAVALVGVGSLLVRRAMPEHAVRAPSASVTSSIDAAVATEPKVAAPAPSLSLPTTAATAEAPVAPAPPNALDVGVDLDAARVEAAGGATPPGDRVTLMNRVESDGFAMWSTAWAAPDGTVFCTATIFSKYCGTASSVDLLGISAVFSSGSPYYPTVVLAGPADAKAATVVFEDGSSAEVEFRTVAGLGFSLGVLRYPNALAGGVASVTADVGAAAKIGLLASTARVVPHDGGGPSLPPGLFPPSPAQPVEGPSSAKAP